MIGWLLGTRIGRWISAVLTGVTIVLAAWFAGRREGGQNARRRAQEADTDNAKDIELRADEARRRFDGDDLDERLRKRGNLRD